MTVEPRRSFSAAISIMILRVEVSALRLRLARSPTQTVLKKQDFLTCWIDACLELRNCPFKCQSRASRRNMTSKTFSSTNKITDLAPTVALRDTAGFSLVTAVHDSGCPSKYYGVCSLWFVTNHISRHHVEQRVHHTSLCSTRRSKNARSLPCSVPEE
jgi:hypothetical protein